MNKNYTIGIDVGGTNTDGVLVNQQRTIIASHKTATTIHISQGITKILENLASQCNITPQQVKSICIGTTHATNALLTRTNLFSVGVLRIAGHNPQVPPGYDWPIDAQQAIIKKSITIDGGYECDGRFINQLNHEQIKNATKELLACGAESIAVIGVFSPLFNDQELQVNDIIKEIAGTLFPVSLSHTIGGTGFIERENATILNAALQKSIALAFHDLEIIIRNLGFTCPIHLTQNNGTLLPLNQALAQPILTIAAGPTNSCVGAAKLAKTRDAIVIDIGGTSTDVGIVCDGFVRRSAQNTTIGGITLNCSMPDILSIALGGGSYISHDHDTVSVGPQSSGKNVMLEARSCGGNKLTLFDVAVLKKHVALPEITQEDIGLSPEIADKIIAHVGIEIAQLVRMIGGPRAAHVPIIAVGGGALLGILDKRYLIPEHAGVANAYGAALAEISATVDIVTSLEQRETVIHTLQEQACKQAIDQGAQAGSVRIVYQDIMPYSYVPGNKARVIITAAGQQK